MSLEHPRTESELVPVLRAAGCVFAEDEAALLVAEANCDDELDRLVERRVAGDPLEVLLGWAQFRGIRVGIDAGVFVPRYRTGFLVELATALAPPDPTVIDLCCGSGALGMAFAATTPETRLYAADIDPAAVACAGRNLVGVGEVFEGDLFAPLPRSLRGETDVLLVNAPYVPTGEVDRMPPEARLHEPLVALDGGIDGLDIHRRVAAEASTWLKPGGTILIETSDRQCDVAIALFEEHGLVPRVDTSEDYDATVVSGTRPRR
jgi:release factor glutamine methyltransferase